MKRIALLLMVALFPAAVHAQDPPDPVLDSIPLPDDGTPADSNLSNAALMNNGPVFLTSSSTQLARLDPVTNELVVADLGVSIHAIGSADAGTFLLAAAAVDAVVLVLDPSLSVVGSLDHAGDDVGGIPGTKGGFILCREGQHIQLVDLGTISPYAQFDFDDIPNCAVGLSAEQGIVLVTLAGGDLVRIDTLSATILDRVWIGQSLSGIADAGEVALVIDPVLGTLTALDVVDLEPVGVLLGLMDPIAVHADPVERLAFVSDASGRISVIDVDPASPRFMKRRSDIVLPNGPANTVLVDGGRFYVSRADRLEAVHGDVKALLDAPLLDGIYPTVGPPGTVVDADPGVEAGANWIVMEGGAVTLTVADTGSGLIVPKDASIGATLYLGLTGADEASILAGSAFVSSPLHAFEVAGAIGSLKSLEKELNELSADSSYTEKRSRWIEKAAEKLEEARELLLENKPLKKAVDKMESAIDKLTQTGDMDAQIRRINEIIEYETSRP